MTHLALLCIALLFALCLVACYGWRRAELDRDGAGSPTTASSFAIGTSMCGRRRGCVLRTGIATTGGSRLSRDATSSCGRTRPSEGSGRKWRNGIEN